MKVSHNWLQRYIDLPESPDEIAASLTLLGFEVDDIESTGLPPLENVVVGEVLDRKQHPDADRLGVCKVALGDALGERQIVCGATNYKIGDRVPVALEGAILPGGFKIKASKLRGVESFGMMCSGKEIGAGEDAAGLLILEGSPDLGTPINRVIADGDTVFNLEVTPNRPDCLSHIGIARELAAWYRRELTYPEITGIPSSSDRSGSEGVFGGVSVDCEEDCPLYMAHVIKGVRIAPSPKWMQSLLSSVGVRPINNIVDVTNFVLHECGNPMHAFDARDIKGGKIRVRHSFDGETMKTLDNAERKLSSQMVVISDAERALAIAGVMGGQNSEVKADTTDLVLEVAYFNPRKIRWVSKNLGLSTDSSYRFERGVDPASLKYASERAIQLILETAGGTLCNPEFVAGKTPAWENEIEFSPNWIRAKAGFEIEDAKIREALELLELKVIVEDDDKWRASIPSHRGDLDRPVDLLEEALRIYGTDKLPSGTVKSTAVAQNDHPITQFVRAASLYLVGQNFSEAVNYTLRSKSEQASWASFSSAVDLALANPISEDQTQLRHSLLPGLLETLKLNQNRKTGATRFFEAGRAFREVNGKVVEMISIGFIECNLGADRTWKERESGDFYLAKKRIETIAGFAGMDLGKFRIKPVDVNARAWQEGHSAAIEEPKAGISARIGLMNISRVKEMDIDGEVIAGIFCILPERLREPKKPKFKSISQFPPSSKDVALVVDKTELASEVVRAVEKLARNAAKGAFDVESVDVFDVYQGIGVPGEKKSIAVSMRFRSMERTLTDKEVNKAFESILASIREKTTYGIRD